MEKKKLSKKAVFGAYIRWLFLNQSNYSYERYMGTGFLHAMNPVVKELYKDDAEGRKEVMKRHYLHQNRTYGSCQRNRRYLDPGSNCTALAGDVH